MLVIGLLLGLLLVVVLMVAGGSKARLRADPPRGYDPFDTSEPPVAGKPAAPGKAEDS